MKTLLNSFIEDKYKLATLIISIVLVILSVYFFKPTLFGGDTVTYIQSMNVLKTGVIGPGFVPNRLTSNYLALWVIILSSITLGNLWFSWILLNSILYIAFSLVFYDLSKRIFENSKVAFWTTILLIGNYAAINFGPATLLDVGGWLFYGMAIFFSYKYFHSKKIDNIWLASVAVSVGGLWKEYTLLALIVIGLSVLFHEWRNPKELFKKSVIVGVISLLPFILINCYVLIKYNYTYLDWFNYQSVYVYKSRIVEYIKAFGSLYNIGWFLFLPAFYIFCSKIINAYKSKQITKEVLDYIFILFILISASPFFIWHAITQRVLFITMPGIILVSGLLFKKYEKYNIGIIAFLATYLLISFFMNSYILDHVNL